MQLPVDIKALVDEMTDIKAARSMPLSLSLYLDEAASRDLAAHVRAALSSSMPNVRLTVTYLERDFIPHPTDDVAVVVAGASQGIGRVAAAVRAVGVPVMVVTDAPGTVGRIAREQGDAIPGADIVSSWEPDEALEPRPLDEAAESALDERMGRWIVSVCREKRLAFAIAFPFMRRPLASDAVQTTSLQNAGVGLVPFIPGADLPIMTLNQAKMVLQVAAAYGQEMGKDRVKELALVVGGAYVSRGVVRKLVAAVPVLGFAIRAGVAYGSTAAMGYAVIEYFEGGENATGVANVAEKAAGAGARLASRVQEVAADPRGFAERLAERAPEARERAAEVVPAVQGAVRTLAPAVRDAVVEHVPKAVELMGDAASRASDALAARGGASAGDGAGAD